MLFRSIAGDATPFPEVNFENISFSGGPAPVHSIPGAKFAKKSSDATLLLCSTTKNPESVFDLATASESQEECAIGEAASGAPDFKSAMKKSAERRADADKSLDKILTVFASAPAKKRAVTRVQKEIASVFSDE